MAKTTPAPTAEKRSARLALRGSLDALQAEAAVACCMVEGKASPALIRDLREVLFFLARLMRAEALGEEVSEPFLFSLTLDEIHSQSHRTMECFGLSPLEPPSPDRGLCHALLNRLRTKVRESELKAVLAFDDAACGASLCHALNRLSSVFHVLMCREASGFYDESRG